MFQRNKGNRDNLLSSLTLNIAFSIVLLALPTSVLLILIGSRTTYIQDGAVYADINLGTLLVFSSMAAILTPCIYRTLPSLIPLQIFACSLSFPITCPETLSNAKNRACINPIRNTPSKTMDRSLSNNLLQRNLIPPLHSPIPSLCRQPRRSLSRLFIQVPEILL